MADLEVKAKMSPGQLAIVIVMICIGVHGQVSHSLLSQAGHGAWMSIVLATVLIAFVSWLMLKLGAYYPNESFAEYMPRLWGRWLGSAAVWLLISIYFLQASYVLHGISREIAFFMFDRTPFEIVEVGLLIVSVYCALQEWGTILRVVQFVFFTAFPIGLFFLLVSFINFRLINFFPIWPVNFTGVISGAIHTYSVFVGYECLLLLAPLVYKQNIKPIRAVWAALSIVGTLFMGWVALQIGDLTLEGAISVPYPLLTVIRTVELPGTFLERLDTYFLIFWIQTIFVSLALSLHLMAKTIAELYRYLDHRPLVLALVPPIFIVGDAAHSTRIFEALQTAVEWTGWCLAGVVIPTSLMLHWWRRRTANGVYQKSSEN